MTSHPLLDRLTDDLGYPRLRSREDVEAFVSRPGMHVILTPGDVARNLETPDVAVILPELRAAFRMCFDCAVAAEPVEAELRQETRQLKTPGLIFYRDGRFVGGITKVRNWDDYIERVGILLTRDAAPAEN